jgi:hypothetical protein
MMQSIGNSTNHSIHNSPRGFNQSTSSLFKTSRVQFKVPE